MNQIDFRLPWPPSSNRYYRSIGGKLIISKVGRIYRESVVKLIHDADMKYGIDCDVKVDIKLAPPLNGRYDIDNYNKAMFDALTHAGFWVDDVLIVELNIKKLPKYAMGEVYISVSEVSDG